MVDWLWRMLGERYGVRLTSQYGETPPESWRVEIAQLGAEAVRRGVERLRNRTELDERRLGWPPSLDEFKAWCREPEAVPYHRDFEKPKALPEPDHVRAARQERGRAAIANMLAIARRAAGVSHDAG